MLIAPHLVAGAVIGKYIDSPFWVVILAILSHFILDAIPHYDSGTIHYGEKELVFDWRDWLLQGIDAVISLGIFWYAYVISDGNILVILGMITAFSVDLVDKIFLISFKDGKLTFKIQSKNSMIRFFNEIHKKINYQMLLKYWYWGILTQLIVIVGGIICLRG